jgi:hypothetical protein
MRASVLMVAVGALLVAACSGNGGSGTTSSGSANGITFVNKGCSLTFSGSYTFTYTVVSGTCGNLQPVHETINGMAMASAQELSSACPNGSGTDIATPTSSGGCTFTASFAGCQIPNNSDTFDLDETVNWNPTDTSATGTFSIDIMGASACSGTYSMTVTQP